MLPVANLVSCVCYYSLNRGMERVRVCDTLEDLGVVIRLEACIAGAAGGNMRGRPANVPGSVCSCNIADQRVKAEKVMALALVGSGKRLEHP